MYRKLNCEVFGPFNTDQLSQAIDSIDRVSISCYVGATGTSRASAVLRALSSLRDDLKASQKDWLDWVKQAMSHLKSLHDAWEVSPGIGGRFDASDRFYAVVSLTRVEEAPTRVSA